MHSWDISASLKAIFNSCMICPKDIQCRFIRFSVWSFRGDVACSPRDKKGRPEA